MNSQIAVVTEPIELARIRQLAEQGFGDMVKAVVDVERGVMALGGDLHADEEAVLLERGSKQSDLWGINLYPDDYEKDDWIRFDSMINIRPSQGNRSRSVEDEKVQESIRKVVVALVRQ